MKSLSSDPNETRQSAVTIEQPEFPNISKIILENFELHEFEDQESIAKQRSLFVRKPKFSLRALSEYKGSLRELLEKIKIMPPITIKKASFAEIPWSLDINDLLGTEFDLINFAYSRLMPIKSIDLNARDKYFLKQKLNLLCEFHLHILFEGTTNGGVEFANMIDEQRDALDYNPLVCLTQLNEALATIEADEYCEYLRTLYYQDLYSLELINLRIKGRDSLPYTPDSKEELQIINETLETAVQSKNFHKIFKSILHTNQIPNSTLNDEICLFTTNWTYSKAILKSLRDEISSFVHQHNSSQSANIGGPNAMRDLASKQLLTDLTELNNDWLLFSDLDEQPKRRSKKSNRILNKAAATVTAATTSPTANKDDKAAPSANQPQSFMSKLLSKNDNIFEFYLNELSLLTIDLTRDLLVYLVSNITEELRSDSGSDETRRASSARSPAATHSPSFDSKPSAAIPATEQLLQYQPPIFQLLMFDNIKKSSQEPTRYSINLHTDLSNSLNSKFINQIKTKLQSFINQLYYRKLLKKHLLNLNHEPDVEMYINTIWQSVISIIRSLNNVDQSYLAEIFLANKRHLQNSSSFIARKYLYYIIRNLFETLYLVCSTIYDRFPLRLTTNELQKNKAKLDSLVDRAFLIHLKNEILIALADADPSIQIGRPNLTRFLNANIARHNIAELLSSLISLIRLKLLQCTFYSSPLYMEFVKINEKFKRMDDSFEKQMNVNLFKVLNSAADRKSGVIKDPTKVITDIIENEILMRYLNLTPRLECLEQVAEIGAQMVLELGMKKNLYFNNN